MVESVIFILILSTLFILTASAPVIIIFLPRSNIFNTSEDSGATIEDSLGNLNVSCSRAIFGMFLTSSASNGLHSLFRLDISWELLGFVLPKLCLAPSGMIPDPPFSINQGSMPGGQGYSSSEYFVTIRS